MGAGLEWRRSHCEAEREERRERGEEERERVLFLNVCVCVWDIREARALREEGTELGEICQI